MALPRAYRYEDEFAAAVAEVEKALPADVVGVKYKFREDWVGEPSVFFTVTLADDVVRRDSFASLMEKISRTFRERLDPEDEWDVHSYIYYASVSEEERQLEPTSA